MSTVVAAGDGYADLGIHRDSTYRIKDGKIIWVGEGWEYNTRLLAQELNLETDDVRRLWNPVENMRFESLAPGRVRAKGKHELKTGCVYQLREIVRDYSAVFVRRSKGIAWKNVNFRFLHGMGIVCQFSEDLSFDSVSIAPDEDRGRTTAAWADCLHISGCRGKVRVVGCTFKGAHDDAINIHGTYLRVVEKLPGNQLKLRFMHKQTYGFMAVNPGDEIEFVDRESYGSHGLGKVRDAVLLSPREMLATLEQPASEDLEPGDVIENVTWTPEVEIRACHVSWVPTRGFLLATRRRTVVEGCEFLATHMSAIHLGIDANEWFESGYVRDLTIRNNRFVHCAEPVIHIEPMNRVANNRVYRNVRIEGNEFLLRNESIVRARSTSGLAITSNKIFSRKALSDEASIDVADCSEVTVRGNRYSSAGQ